MKTIRPVVFCGPSGSGKSTLIAKLKAEFADIFGFSVSHTTRNPRPGERDGEAYHFVTRSLFESMIRDQKFIETAEFSGNLYGTSFEAVKRVEEGGRICILDIDVQGVKQIKKTDLNPHYVFIQPPSLDVLERRLRGRGTETEESLKMRLNTAIEELKYAQDSDNFDVVIVNDDIDRAYTRLKAFLLPFILQVRDN